ncbi:MAG: pantetheine-phosphate adenylyltransferase [Candidatus Zixiibacteriota bacterium]|nr:MAG: pantetheine-phosphate adenylyltransferase [candidate division Zixibacteria bacterium]
MPDKLAIRAVYPGSFDPVTNGHLSLIERARHLFDDLIVAVAENAGKEPLFSSDERFDLMKQVVEGLDHNGRIQVIRFTGLTAELVVELKATVIVRGLRAVSDFEYEFQMALMNRKLARDVETVFLMPSLSWVYLSSSLVKDVAYNGGDITGLVPAVVAEAMNKKIAGDT